LASDETELEATLDNGANCVPSLCSYLLLFLPRSIFEFSFSP